MLMVPVHSDDPNLAAEFGRDGYSVDVARRDIAAGEELTIDYGVVVGWRPEPADIDPEVGQ